MDLCGEWEPPQRVQIKKEKKFMNRGKMKKVLALMLTFIFVISATACGGATKFDAEAYVRGVMDANYKQKYDEYAKARGISEKDAKAEIEDTLDEQVDTELSGLEALGDFTEEEKQEYKDMLVKIDNLAKYEVKEAKEDKDGNFTVTIEVTPSDVYQTLEDNSTAVAQEMMDQGQDVSQADASMFQDLLIRNAGAENAAAELTDPYWATVSYEQLLAWNPDAIVLAPMAEYTVEDVLADPALADLDAVKNGKVYAMPNVIESWDSPIPSSCLGSVWMASVLYPDAVSTEDYKKACVDFYQQFYGFDAAPVL